MKKDLIERAEELGRAHGIVPELVEEVKRLRDARAKTDYDTWYEYGQRLGQENERLEAENQVLREALGRIAAIPHFPVDDPHSPQAIARNALHTDTASGSRTP